MSSSSMRVFLALLVVVCTATVAGAEPSRKLLGQRPGIHLNDKDVAAVQKKADKDAALKFKEAVDKYSKHPHKSGWAAFQMKSDKEKKEWEAKRAAFTGEQGSNKRKSSPTGYKGFVAQSMEVQKKWHALNQRALSKGHIEKLPGVVDQPYKGKQYKTTEGQGTMIKKTDKEGVALSS